AELGDVLAEYAPQVGQLRLPAQGFSYIAKAGRDGRKELRVLFDAIDKDEASRVLELPLSRLEIEEPSEGAGIANSCALDIVRDELIEQLRCELDVGIAEQRYKVVELRSHESVLEVDEPKSGPVLDHEVAALVVAMDEDTGQVGQGPSDGVEGVGESLA